MSESTPKPNIEDGKYRNAWSLPGSAERNSIPICDAITPLLEQLRIKIKSSESESESRRVPKILEIASGIGIQITKIAKSNPEIQFQPTDADIYLASKIDEKVEEVGVGGNVLKAMVLDLLEESDWVNLFDSSSSPDKDDEISKNRDRDYLYDGILVCNLTHIAPFEVTESLFQHLERKKDEKTSLLNQEVGFIAFYGAFNENGGFTSEGNRKFDESIKTRNSLFGLRDIDEELIPLAKQHGYTLSQRDEVPSGNKWLVFRPT